MSTDAFLLLLLVALVTRHAWAPRPGLRGWGAQIALVLVQMLLAALLLDLPAPVAVWTMLLAAQAAHILLLRRLANPHLARTLSLALALLLLALVAGEAAMVGHPRVALARALDHWAASNALLSALPPDTGHRLLVTAAALWLAVMEANHPVAFFLKRIDLLPAAVTAAGPSPEPARGRMIGRLERGLVCLMALSGTLSGLGLLLAAKAFARYRDMDERAFAEYVLIGTLLSISAALAVGLAFTLFI
ncbi:MAG: hypothetical protein Q8O14_14375 [bacterium]|jgi:hypothetical protein|nr:hypothetical protein [bacterium]